ncbi:MAG: hypothetical protein ACYTAF_02450 [Planctomycetota bacterium]
MADVKALIRMVNQLRIQADGTAHMEAQLREARYRLARQLGTRGARGTGSGSPAEDAPPAK